MFCTCDLQKSEESYLRYGKIRIEDGYLAFSRHMILNSLPCKDIMWAFMRREGDSPEGGAVKQIISNYLVIVTRRKKRYKFDMSEKEIHECLRHLKALNPNMAVGFPKGGRLSLQSLPNTRDLGALSAKDGRHILPRKLLRSGELYHMSLADQQLLTEEYHLKAVIDFRSGTERRQKPDTILQGVEYYHIPVLDEDTIGISGGRSVSEMLLGYEGDAEKYMEARYEAFIRDKFSVSQYARFLDVLLHQDGTVLWHCGAGKDRAGVASALLLSVLGVSKSVIREDFMRSNLYLDSELSYMMRYLEDRGLDTPRRAQNMDVFYKVKESYLDRFFYFIEKEYGSVERFWRRGLYLTPKAVEDLQEKYLI